MSAQTSRTSLLTLSLPRGGDWAQGLRQAWRAATTRPRLAELDDRMLRDVGLTPGQARVELSRAPWDTTRR